MEPYCELLFRVDIYGALTGHSSSGWTFMEPYWTRQFRVDGHGSSGWTFMEPSLGMALQSGHLWSPHWAWLFRVDIYGVLTGHGCSAWTFMVQYWARLFRVDICFWCFSITSSILINIFMIRAIKFGDSSFCFEKKTKNNHTNAQTKKLLK